MSEAPWSRQLIPAIVALALVPMARGPAPGPVGTEGPLSGRMAALLPCAARTVTAPTTRLVERVAGDGSLVGYRLELAAAGSRRTIVLPSESFVVGPYGPAVLVGSDDGGRSTLRLVGAERGCERHLATSDLILRRATVDPSGSWLVALQLERGTRRDLGVHRRPLEGGAWRPLADPLRADAPRAADRIGPVYATSFAWSEDGATLAVQSCGERECVTRLISDGRRILLGSPGQGPLVRLGRDDLVTQKACAGIPCPTVRTKLSSGEVLQ